MIYFVSLRLTFILMPNLEVKEYCEGQYLANAMKEAYVKVHVVGLLTKQWVTKTR